MTPGLIDIRSNHSVEETVNRLKQMFDSKGVTLFATIDHSGEAAKAGMMMPPTKLLIFGNPKAGTPLMLEAPASAIDLPLKLLVWQDGDGKTWLTYNSPQYMLDRYGLSSHFVETLAAGEIFARKAAE